MYNNHLKVEHGFNGPLFLYPEAVSSSYYYSICILVLTAVVTIGFEETIYYVSENENQIEICVMLQSGHLSRPVSLIFSSSNGSAQSPKDYTDVMLETMFKGDRKCIDILITDDNIVEDNESFFLRLNSTDLTVTINLPVISVTIIDNDIVLIGFQQTQYTVRESSGQLDLLIRLNGSLEKNVTLMVESRDQTASVRGGDYTVMTETLTFPSGSAAGFTLTLTVAIRDDSIVEEEEYFTVHVSSVDVGIHIDEVKKAVSIYIKDDDCKILYVI